MGSSLWAIHGTLLAHDARKTIRAHTPNDHRNVTPPRCRSPQRDRSGNAKRPGGVCADQAKSGGAPSRLPGRGNSPARKGGVRDGSEHSNREPRGEL